ncbi:MAG: rhodanese-like domain-containing protein [Bacilli bacterium]
MSEHCPTITIQALKSRMFGHDAAQIIDVREIDEYRSGHIEGSVLIPLAELPYRLHEIDHRMDLILVCRSGNRSAEACEILHTRGFSNAKTLTGGLTAWTA